MIGFCRKCNRVVNVPEEKQFKARCRECLGNLSVSTRPLRPDTTDGTILYYEDEYEYWYKVINPDKQRGISGHYELDKSFNDDIIRKIARIKELREQYPQVNFWIKKIVWKLPLHTRGYIQFTIRPYVQGYGCDGTTDENIHLLGSIWGKRNRHNYANLYKMAYGEREGYNPKEIKQWVNDLLTSQTPLYINIRNETIIPKLINKSLLVEDLRDINNYALADIIEDLPQKV